MIELTLTTIYELDKLLQLLRSRSDLLDLLQVRLSWEEHRVASWIERRQIIADVETFLSNRTRWSPDVYENSSKPDRERRGSTTSLTSDSFAASTSKFSLSLRFNLAESLSRDAAQFTGRVSALRNVKIPAAGKALDKLIDNSRKPIPEELLDEQERLEERGINELKSLPSFVMTVIAQWKK